MKIESFGACYYSIQMNGILIMYKHEKLLVPHLDELKRNTKD